jgi:hypothetical protein
VLNLEHGLQQGIAQLFPLVVRQRGLPIAGPVGADKILQGNRRRVSYVIRVVCAAHDLQHSVRIAWYGSIIIGCIYWTVVYFIFEN